LYPIHNMKLFAFLDTNIFLHYETIDHIDWQSHFESDEIVLIIAPVVIRELNRHKDFPSSPKPRDRAAASLSRLHEWLDREAPIFIRSAVELQFHAVDPLLDFASEKLSRDIPDDHLIATVIEFRSENPSGKTVIVTDDLGLKLKSKSHAIQTFQLPISSRLPEEPDASEKRIKQLERELRRFQQRNPVLKLLFSTRQDHLRLAPKAPEAFTKEDVRRSMDQVRAKYPKANKTGTVAAVSHLDRLFPAPDTEQYNQALDKFYVEYEKYLWARRAVVIFFSLCWSRCAGGISSWLPGT